MTTSRIFVLVALVLCAAPSMARAEPHVLGRQYSRCTTCHYSPTGGGLLTPYGRSLSHQELSTFGPDASATPAPAGRGEEAFLFGAAGGILGPVQLGLDLRPSHLEFSVNGLDSSRNLLMNADLTAAVQVGNWTLYGEVGRQPSSPDATIDSYEYWAGRLPEAGLGVRVGRFLPAYGVRFADHTAYNRASLGLDKYDQVLGVEVSRATTRSLLQVSLSPGRADALFGDANDPDDASFTASGRLQVDLSPRATLVASALFRDESASAPRDTAGGLAFGVSPLPRLTVWTQADLQQVEGSVGGRRTRFVFVNETAYEAARGLWLKLSPQLRTSGTEGEPDMLRTAFTLQWLPRTHWNGVLTYYRDVPRGTGVTVHTVLTQLHLYL